MAEVIEANNGGAAPVDDGMDFADLDEEGLLIPADAKVNDVWLSQRTKEQALLCCICSAEPRMDKHLFLKTLC